MFELHIQDFAIEDIDNSATWYSRISPDISRRFRQEVRRKLSFIESNPYLYPVLEGVIHYASLHKFPHSIFYYVLDNQIIVIACIHHSRDRDKILEERT